MRHIILIVLALTLTAAVSACNTVHGVGATLEKSSDRSKP